MANLKKPLLGRLVVLNMDVDVRMRSRATRSASDDALQPLVAIVFLFRRVVVVGALRAILIV